MPDKKIKSTASIVVPRQDQEPEVDPAMVPVTAEFDDNIDIGDEVTYPCQDTYGGRRRTTVTEVTETEIQVVWRDGSRRWFPRHKIERV